MWRYRGVIDNDGDVSADVPTEIVDHLDDVSV